MKFKAYLRLFRLPNLLMIALTQYMVRFFLIIPNLHIDEGMKKINEIDFALFVLSTIFIAVAGYIINDYFDLRADRVNRPDKMPLRFIPRRLVILLHWGLNISGILIGFYLAYKLNFYKFGIINVFVAILLWYYSTSFKKQLYIGNIIIALLTSLIIIVTWLYFFVLFKDTTESIRDMFYIFRRIIMPYFEFAFLLSIVREIAKDAEDIKGDLKISCETFPIVYGIKKTNIFIIVLLVITLLLISYFQYIFYTRNLNIIFLYLLITVQIPILYLIFKVRKTETKEEYSFISGMCKIIMFAGILSMQMFYLN